MSLLHSTQTDEWHAPGCAKHSRTERQLHNNLPVRTPTGFGLTRTTVYWAGSGFSWSKPDQLKKSLRIPKKTPRVPWERARKGHSKGTLIQSRLSNLTSFESNLEMVRNRTQIGSALLRCQAHDVIFFYYFSSVWYTVCFSCQRIGCHKKYTYSGPLIKKSSLQKYTYASQPTLRRADGYTL